MWNHRGRIYHLNWAELSGWWKHGITTVLFKRFLEKSNKVLNNQIATILLSMQISWLRTANQNKKRMLHVHLGNCFCRCCKNKPRNITKTGELKCPAKPPDFSGWLSECPASVEFDRCWPNDPNGRCSPPQNSPAKRKVIQLPFANEIQRNCCHDSHLLISS